MKTNARITLLVVALAALAVGPRPVTGQAIDSVEGLKNRAILASPRAKEVFPALRGVAPAVARDAGQKPLADIRKNRAILASPRALEQFPELRPMGRPRAVTREGGELAAIRANRALAATPRMLELFPALAIRTVEACSCDVALLK
jgi:ABC-type branched-subunit amino acid transport system ATPase component